MTCVVCTVACLIANAFSALALLLLCFFGFLFFSFLEMYVCTVSSAQLLASLANAFY